MNLLRPSWRAYALGMILWIMAFLIALKLGASDQLDYEMITQLRLPRALLAGAVGIGLAVAGATLQAVFANPLCEPYTMGISSGSALGAVIGISLGLEWNFAGIAGSAFLGALGFAFFLYLISLKSNSNTLTLLLSGVMLGFLGSSLVALWMALADTNGIQGAIFWLMGDLSRARLSGAIVALILAVGLSVLVWMRSRELDALLMGEETATTLGVPVPQVRRVLMILSSLLIGLCVSSSGMIGFVGLVIPHVVRRSQGSLHRGLIPLVAIWGAAVLTLSDTLARWAFRPYELPVGIVTALAGAPVFLWMMIGKKGGAS